MRFSSGGLKPRENHDMGQRDLQAHISSHGVTLTEEGHPYSTVTDFARFLGWSTSQPRRIAMWYARSCIGRISRIDDSVVDHVVGRFFNFLVAFGRQRDHYAGAGFDLFQVGEGLFVAHA